MLVKQVIVVFLDTILLEKASVAIYQCIMARTKKNLKSTVKNEDSQAFIPKRFLSS